ncbi:MAG: F0F1 ATP synthase subunit gamma [Caenibius sp.]
MPGCEAIATNRSPVRPGSFDVAHLIFAEFKPALAQDPLTQQLIPVPAPATASESGAVVEYELGEEEILEELLPRYVKTDFRRAVGNRRFRTGASMTAMDNATRNAGELIDKLTIQYNRSAARPRDHHRTR